MVGDPQDFLLGVLVTEANGSERLGAVVILQEAKEKLGSLKKIWVDAGYSGPKFANTIQQVCGERVEGEVIKRSASGFEKLPKRWIVERTEEIAKT